MRTIDISVPEIRFQKDTLLWGALLVNTELLVLLAYGVLGSTSLRDPLAVRYWLYPFVWINVGLWAVLRTRPAPSSTRHRRLAAVLAVGYFGLLAYTGGVVGHAHQATGLRISWWALPPGWGPAVLYNGMGLSLNILPYKVFGYGALAYLVYATVLDAVGSAVTGLLGLLSCVSCTWPVLASLVTGVVGSGTAIAGAVYAQSYGLSTVVFVVTVALLYWRPFGKNAN
ncbi:hypothetical protein VB773_15070 [Haloarculaceae archaeon H-GB2-1]|nr:hypothetical protein [Haloarculaceae archaeon H-GB1-1]MEA5387289.1 hypothetical protein [Haloarculaceae archaeon H-GB11]MEA5408755.1 hypothetical protein [Haloarculaceae archaeon H-GB2-1]